MKTFNEFIDYLKKENYTEFTFKSISIFLGGKFNIPKSKIIFYCKIMKEFGMIKKVSIRGCQSVCASCYEYGCDAGDKPPVNYWKVTTLKKITL